ncbi:unnamed protein product [Effrenium voratum]|nr:unnamed protein product [Effrenium voratum]
MTKEGAETGVHSPAPGFTVQRFCLALLALAARAGPASSAAGSLAELLDVGAWAGGAALQEIPSTRALASKILFSCTEPERLHAWRSAAAASAGAWGAGQVPERLRHLVAVAAALLKLDFQEPEARHGGALLEAVLGVPRLGGPFATFFRNGEEGCWSLALAQLLQRYQGQGSHRQGSAKALEQNYAMAYAAGNLWELYSLLPLAPFLEVMAFLVERAVEVSMLPGAAATRDEPLALQELRRQLRPLEAQAVQLWSQVLQLRFRPKEHLAMVPLRAYQRHCLAVVAHQVQPRAVRALALLYSSLMVKARLAARTGANHALQIANAIAYMESGDASKALWRHIQSVVVLGKGEMPNTDALHMIHLHAVLLSQSLTVMTQEELRSPDAPLCKHDFGDYVGKVTALASRLAWHGNEGAQIGEEVLEACGRVLSQLYGRRKALQLTQWQAPENVLEPFKAQMKELLAALQQPQSNHLQLGLSAERLLRFLPQAVPFEQRVALLRARVQLAREAALSRPVVKLVVRRTHLFEDGLTSLMVKDAEWRARFQVVFVNATGRPEQGQDAGGLFKEFWEKLAETAFNPEYGLFRMTDERLLFPNPEAGKYHENVDTLFEFLGLVIGKAIFEGIVVEPCFAPFFLAKLLGKHNSYYDLRSLDPALFSNLQQLKTYSGDVSELCLSFVASSGDGEVPLLPRGQEISVTAENRVRYIYMLSDFKLNRELQQASSAFLAGFRRLIEERWLHMFSEDELQQVISGSSGGTLDVDDLQRHTQLSNCSGPRDRVVADFFTALRAMSPQHQMKLLRFVTSCSRAPLLGFSHLQPPFTVHKARLGGGAAHAVSKGCCRGWTGRCPSIVHQVGPGCSTQFSV